MSDLSKIDDIIMCHYQLLTNKHGPSKADSLVVRKLKKLGAKQIKYPLEEDEISEIVKFSQQNSDCVLFYFGYDEKGHDLFAIPRGIAEKIVVLGGLP